LSRPRPAVDFATWAAAPTSAALATASAAWALAATPPSTALSAACPFFARLRSVPHRRFEFPAAVYFQPDRDIFRWDIPHFTALSAPNHQEIARLAKRSIAKHLYLRGLKYQVQNARGAFPEGNDGVTSPHQGVTRRQQQRLIRIKRAEGFQIVAPERLDEIVMEPFEPSYIFIGWHEKFPFWAEQNLFTSDLTSATKRFRGFAPMKSTRGRWCQRIVRVSYSNETKLKAPAR
jgi:hypothetical protein